MVGRTFRATTTKIPTSSSHSYNIYIYNLKTVFCCEHFFVCRILKKHFLNFINIQLGGQVRTEQVGTWINLVVPRNRKVLPWTGWVPVSHWQREELAGGSQEGSWPNMAVERERINRTSSRYVDVVYCKCVELNL